MEKYFSLAGSFLKRHYGLHLGIGLVFCLLSGCFISFRNLEAAQCAKVMEMYVSLVGIILLTPLFWPEQDLEIWSLEKTKAMELWKLYLLRLLIGLVGVGAVISLFLGVLQHGDSSFPAGQLWLGSFTEAVFLGAIGFFVSAVTNQVVLGYMAAVVYFMLNFGAFKYLGKFALFQMSRGDYEFWPFMAIGAVLLLVLGIVLRERRQ